MKNQKHEMAFTAVWWLFALTFAQIVACADLVIRDKVEYRGGGYWADEDNTIRIKSDKLRVDTVHSMPGSTNSGVTSVITDSRSGDSITLLDMYGQKWAVKTSGAQMKQIMADAADKTTPLPPQNSGQTAMVGGYQTEIYIQTNFNGVSTKLWVAKDFPNCKLINGQLAELHGLGATVKNLDLATLPGMVMKSETEMGGKHAHVVTTTVLSAKEEPVDASVFVVPNDYQPMDAPHQPISQPKQP